MNKNKIDKIYDYKSLFEGQTYILTLSTVQTFCEFDETSLTFIDVHSVWSRWSTARWEKWDCLAMKLPLTMLVYINRPHVHTTNTIRRSLGWWSLLTGTDPLGRKWHLHDAFSVKLPWRTRERGRTSYLSSSIYTDTGFPWQRDNNKRLMASARHKV